MNIVTLLGLLLTLLSAEALDWSSKPGYREAALPSNQTGQPGFHRVLAADSGVTFSNVVSLDRYTTNQIYLNGSGVTAGDVDGDGWCDVFLAGMDGGSALYRNLGGWKFTNVTATAGINCAGLDVTGAVFADLDGDSDLDLIVNTVAGGTHIFLNDGHGHFTPGAVLNPDRAGMSLAVGDLAGTGNLDIYVANYRPKTLRDQPHTDFRINKVDGKLVVALVNGQPVTAPSLAGRFTYSQATGILEHGEPDVLLRNDGKGGLVPVSFTEGTFLDEAGQVLSAPLYDWGLSVMIRDLNGDGQPDIYVCNDFDSVDRLWLNDGTGKFRAASPLTLRNTSKFSMGIDVADINRDGFDDLLVLDMQSRSHVRRMTRMDKSMDVSVAALTAGRPQFTRNTLQLGRGDGTFAEIANYAGLNATEWSWTPIFLDVDLDGFEDLLVTTGHGRDDMDLDIGQRNEALRRSKKMPVAEELGLRRQTPPIKTPLLAFRNRDGLRFDDVGKAWGFDTVGIGHGMCLADLDNDGDLDVVVNNLNAPAGFYRNEATAPRVAVRLLGSGHNTRGIGARIRLLGGAVPQQSQEMIGGGRYLSGDDYERVFAAGSLTNVMHLEVVWRSGRRSVVTGVRANHVYEIAETGAEEMLKPVTALLPPLFEDVSERLGHEHHEEKFDDFERQPWLPNRLSQLGPGAGWMDLDGDGRDDLVIGSGKGGRLAAFQNDGRGGFRPWEGMPFAQTVSRDQTGIVGWPRPDGRIVLLAGAANYEDGLEAGGGVREYDPVSQQVKDLLPGSGTSTGPLALGDVDGDGDLDLFVGGRVIAGHYPEAAASRLYENREGQWVLSERNTAELKGAGLVSGAVWSDLDGDGYPELILACEWGPVRLFKNQQGHLHEVTREWGLDQYTGWWNGVSAGDFDGDGRMDIVASNWGLNTKYHASRQHPRRLYFGDLGGLGQVGVIESYFDSELEKWVPERDLNALSGMLPWLREKFPAHLLYAQAGVAEILGEHLKEAQILEAGWLQTTVFLNRGDHFELGKLPPEAQFSPAFGVNVGDLDGDGKEDLFLGQNFFAVAATTARNDAGRGLCLRGDGVGGFVPLLGQVSGIKVYGEQRGSALGDYDGDGRVDLVVTQNGAKTQLYHNLGATPGLRVRLRGPAGNPQGVGAVLRLAFADGKSGPAREVHAGSGYWSQDSVVQVLATPTPPLQIQVRWPGAKVFTVTDLRPDSKEVILDVQGRILPAH